MLSTDCKDFMAIATRSWYVLMFNQGVATIKKEFATLSIKRAYEGKGPIEYYMPTCYFRVNKFGTSQQVTRKMPFSYVFIRETELGIREIKRFVPTLRMFTLPGSKHHDTRYVKLSDQEMSMLKIIANAYSEQLPCHHIEDFKLEDCDDVRVVEGVFKGLEGKMTVSPGRNSGKVILPVGNLFLVSSGEILHQYTQILAFAKGSRHPYYVFDAHLPRAIEALSNKLTKGELDDNELASMLVFTGRLENLQPPTLIIESFYSGLMLMSYAAIGESQKDAKEHWLKECYGLLPQLKSEIQIGLQLSMMYASTGAPELAEQLHRMIDEWQPIEPSQKKKKTIADILTRFKAIYNK